jgi:Arc/MetJ family transcription regulator
MEALMSTNLQIDDRLIIKARELGRHKTKKDAVTQALKEYIQRMEQQKIVKLFGKIDYDPDYDYKAQRSRN